MLKAGLTGGIASGKSSVSKWFAAKGITVFDADKVVHESYLDPTVVAKIEQAFGSKYIENDQVNRSLLAAKIFSDHAAKRSLEGIIHPYVLAEMQERCKISESKSEKLIILDIPLLLEAGWERFVDEVWVVYVSFDIQLERLMLRNGFSAEEAKLRILSQMSLEEKLQKADRIIDNSGSWLETEKQLEKISEELLKRL